ncbi:MAG TPA: dockerin type I repeat-containing protein [Phycisphaerae bacterium]|nr:dockerin type I repeat-containing protein [Phycisphaerae bacterium]HRW53761.1 dockerin type I repeat-containing protein [Phycisphaerae bacterium]
MLNPSNCRPWRATAIATATIGVALTCGVAVAQNRYHAKNVGAFGTGEYTQANALNNEGAVVGHGQVCFLVTGYRPFLWTYADGMRPLYPQNDLGFGVSATHISDDGGIFGGYIDAGAPTPCSSAQIPALPFGSKQRNVLWNRDGFGVEQLIPGLGGQLGLPNIQTSIGDTNAFGDVVGGSYDGADALSGEWRGYLYSTTTQTLTNLEFAAGPGVTVRQAVGVNNAGGLLAQATTLDGERIVYIDADAVSHILPRLSNDVASVELPRAVALRDDGEVLAWSERLAPTGSPPPLDQRLEYAGLYTWRPHGGLTDLTPTLPPDRRIVPAALGAAGEVLAMDVTPSNSTDPADYLPRPYLYDGAAWRRLDEMTTLIYPDDRVELFNKTYWILRSMNDAGQILINVRFDGDEILMPSFQSFVLTPYPALNGDINRDGTVDGDDIALFVEAIQGAGRTLWQEAAADTNRDSELTVEDIPPMINALLSQ